MKLELLPSRHSRGIRHKPEFAVAALNPEFGDMIWELKQRGGKFEEMSGQFRIYRENTGVIILELVMDTDLLDTIEDDLDNHE